MAPKGRGLKKFLQKLPNGTILIDGNKVQWKIIEPIGEGGFGVIYGVEKVGSPSKNKASYVAKIEPHSNGPLFVEKNFFMRHLQPNMIAEYKRAKKIPFLGLPEYVGGGTYKDGDIEHRFLIMERFGDSIDKRLKATEKVNYKLLGTYCSQVIDALTYIHERGYAHMDIKPENLLLKCEPKCDLVYLIDFGIVDRCTTADVYTPDKKKQHNGTTLYTSRDSHQGVVTKRSDLEILGYNILQWLRVDLPWAKDVKNLTAVLNKKNELLNNIRNVLGNDVPGNIIKYFDHVNNLKHNETPDYNYMKSLLENLESPEDSVSRKKKPVTKSALSKRSNLSDQVLETENIVPSRRKPIAKRNYVEEASQSEKEIPHEIEVPCPDEKVESHDYERNILISAVGPKPSVKKRITSPPKKVVPKKITSPKRITSPRRTRRTNK